ncbi:MAG: response regulator transcription factor [Mangrovibacterium sp.]
METNVTKIEASATLPAGFAGNTEGFWRKGQKWLIHEGTLMPFTEAPTRVQNMIVEHFSSDTVARRILDEQGIRGFSAQFDAWYKCRAGALDHTPDFRNGVFTADAYNNACTDYHCPLRGKLCGVQTGLKNYEAETLKLLAEGLTICQVANKMCVSYAGMKSRVEHLKEKLGASNLPNLIARATQIGIQ